MHTPFKDIIAKNEQEANNNGSLVSWGLCLVIMLTMAIMAIRHPESLPFSNILLLVVEILMIFATSLYVRLCEGEGRGIRYLLIAVMLFAATANSFITSDLRWGYYMLPVIFSIRYCLPGFTVATGIVSSLSAYFVGYMILRMGFTANGYVDLNYVTVSEPVTVDIREGILGIYGPLFESGKIDAGQMFSEYFYHHFTSLLNMLVATAICAVITRLYRNHILVELENVEKTMTIAEQKLREEQQSHQIAEIQALNAQLKEQREVASTAQQEAVKASKAKTTFLNNMSHDMRTPMNAIIGYTALATSNLDNKQQVTEYLSKISASSQYLLSLINGILDINGIESGNIQLDEKESRLTDVLKNLRAIIQGAVNVKQLNLFINTKDLENDRVVCDAARLSQILVNLVGNAVKFTPAGGTISILMQQRNSSTAGMAQYDFHVKDTGPGMSKETLQHVFDAFSSAAGQDSQILSRNNASGMGLAITKHLVDLMGANIQVITEKNKGAEFIVSFSFKTVADAEQTHGSVGVADDKVVVDHYAGMHVLLAEDNPLNQEIISMQLEKIGFVVDVANDGLEAASRIINNPAGSYNFILMDVVMPKMDGYEATRIIRAIPDNIKSQIPIIAISANVFEQDKQNALEAGMNGHIGKPIDTQTLLEEISRILGSPKNT